MPEKNLLAAFTSLEAVTNCQTRLFHEGFDVVQVDDLTSSPSPLPHAPMVEWGRHGYESRRLDDKWTSSASWDMSATGMVEGSGWLLTAVVPSSQAGNAARIIEQYGGKL